eukprot:CAMPEP_0177410674 /NCGR_PEP_ID=MMETSP0368-20130122/64974_1 /TAXON_ID=447022 ORGANISM="Scrippsiella hangoei-like, Strain SHHI-4" /NCGR_SAMPLE_ID=MMETSP0368 /ASSEMBLY_ACC=CAM_ASM_000363 /LENGTH=167 /DNA_ID=CAMNT_0018879667 /DNA_START=58 /DNA_END=561 /DNA_ORIENTATION=-
MALRAVGVRLGAASVRIGGCGLPATRAHLLRSLSATSQTGIAARSFSSHSDFEPKSHVKDAGNDEVQQKLAKLVKDNKVTLFMKGSPDAPQCGFSRAVVQTLSDEKYDDYAFVDVLKYPEVREGIKKFSDWPTVPQLYVNAEFIGGCDIVVQMHKDGELKEVLDKAK